MNDGDNDDSRSVRKFVKRESRLRKAAEAIAMLGLTPKLEVELAECLADQRNNYSHDFIIDKAKWL